MSRKIAVYFFLGALLCNLNTVHAYWRFVLSGGPGIGKTTVLKELERRGYQTISETYTALFEQASLHNALDVFFNGPEQLESILLAEQVRREASLSPLLPAFLDRSCVDIIAYGDYLQVALTDHLRSQADRDYDLVFFLEPLPADLYQNTSVRKESREVALEIHSMLKVAYMQRGYKPHQLIDVPFGTPDERAQYILDTISRVYFTIDILDYFANTTAWYPLSALESVSVSRV